MPAIPYRPADPNLVTPAKPPWGKTFTKPERRTAGALCDTILPADDRSPAASDPAVLAHDLIDDWISAPYPEHEADKAAIRGGLAWLNTESTKRFGKAFAEATAEQQRAICADLAPGPEEVAPPFRSAAAFFARYRQLTVDAYYTTAAGRNDLRYIGNVSLPKFDGPPKEVLEHLGLA